MPSVRVGRLSKPNGKSLLLALLVCGTAGAAPAPDIAVYGFTLGQPLGLVECQRDAAGYAISVKAACFERLETLPDRGTARFPFGAGPKHSRTSAMGFGVRDGGLDLVIVWTLGAQSQHLVFDDLVAKYGQPTSSRSAPVTSALGAKLEAITATWRFDNLEVHFSGIEGKLDQGLLLIGTPTGIREYHERLKRLSSERRPL